MLARAPLAATLSSMLKRVHRAGIAERRALLAPGEPADFNQGAASHQLLEVHPSHQSHSPAAAATSADPSLSSQPPSALSSLPSWPVSFMLQLATVCMGCGSEFHNTTMKRDMMAPQAASTAMDGWQKAAESIPLYIPKVEVGYVFRGDMLYFRSFHASSYQSTANCQLPTANCQPLQVAPGSWIPRMWLEPRPSLHMMLWSSVRCV